MTHILAIAALLLTVQTTITSTDQLIWETTDKLPGISREMLPSSSDGAFFELPQGMLLVGGEQLGDQTLLTRNDGSKENWPSLPFRLSGMAYGRIADKIYLSGGLSDGKECDVLLCLDLEAKSRGWQQLPPCPSGARAYAAGAVQSNGQDNCLYVFGGFRDGTQLDECWSFNPRLQQWKKVKGSFGQTPFAAFPTGTNHIILLGEKNSIRLFHSITGTKLDIDNKDVRLPGDAVLISRGESFYLVGKDSKSQEPQIMKATVASRYNPLSWIDLVVIVLYFAVLIAMGWFFSKRQHNADDYFKGGGRIPWFIVGLSIFGTALSAITFMSIPAKAYATDWSYILFNAGIVMVAPLITLVFIPFFRHLGVTTAYEYLERRYNPLVRVLCSISFIIYQVGRMGVVLLLPAIALNVVTGFNIFLCVGMMGVFSLVYTYMGGIEAVAWTDALQVVVLIGAAVAVVAIVCSGTEGGMAAVISTAAADTKFHLGSTKFDLRQTTIWTTLIATTFTNITTYGTDQTIVQRYLTTKTEHEAKKSVWINALLTIPSTILFFFVGTCLYVYFKNHPSDLSASIANPDAILPWFVSMRIPVGVTGLVIAGIFAAAMSTLSASMNSAATAFFTDIYSKSRLYSSKDALSTAKKSTLIIGIIGVCFALVMASWDVKSLWDEFSKILGILLGGLGGLFLLGFFSRKANWIGAVCGLVGCITVQLTVMHFQAVNLLLYSTVGFVSCFVIGWIVSVLTGGCKKDLNGLLFSNLKK